MKQAALETLATHGFSGLTLEKICDRARVPRATFYRRWATPMEAVGEAFNEAFHFRDLPDTGDVVRDLILFAQDMLKLYNDPVLGPCMSFLIPEGRVRPELSVHYAEAFRKRRAHNRQVVERAIARGEVGPVIEPDVMIDVLSGLAMNNYATGRPVTEASLEVIIRRLLQLDA